MKKYLIITVAALSFSSCLNEKKLANYLQKEGYIKIKLIREPDTILTSSTNIAIGYNAGIDTAAGRFFVVDTSLNIYKIPVDTTWRWLKNFDTVIINSKTKPFTL